MNIPEDELRAIERHFHELLLEVQGKFNSDFRPELPTLVLDGPNRRRHVRISGMLGGCSYWWAEKDGLPMLKVDATSRLDHNFLWVWHVTTDGYERVDPETVQRFLN